MAENGVFIRPIQQFEDNIRPAQLMLHVFRLLDCQDDIVTEGTVVDRLREIVEATSTEDLMVVQNEIFLGLVREGADLAPATLKSRTLNHLLRQAIVASCTALDAFLPSLLRLHLPQVIETKKGDFLPDDKEVLDYLSDLKFGLPDVLRLMDDEGAFLFISNKIIGLSTFRYLSNPKGVHVVGRLLGIEEPWPAIAAQLQRPDTSDLKNHLQKTVQRRSDIVHRADRSRKDLDGDQQPIGYAQASQGVDTIKHVCHALNELVEAKLQDLTADWAEAAQ